MKKSEKKIKNKWTKPLRLNILCALLVYTSLGMTYLVSENTGELQLSRGKEDNVIEQVRKESLVHDRVTELEKLKKVRHENSRLVMRMRKMEKELEKLRFQAASLLISKTEDEESREKWLLEDLKKKNSVLEAVEVELKQLLKKMTSIPNRKQTRTDVVVETLRRTVATLKRSNSLPSLVAKRDGKSISQMRVLSVNEDLQVVVLNAGSENGIRLGTTWIVADPGKDKQIKLKVVEVRRTICAAAVETGDIGLVKTGDVTNTGN